MTKTWLMLPMLCAFAGCGGQQPPPLKATVDTKALMISMEQQANFVWESVSETITGNDIVERRPHTDAEWLQVKNAAIMVAEAGNLLMIAPRAQDGDRWMKASAGLIAQGERMIAAAERKSPKEVFDVGSDLYDACVACHVQYMPAIKEMYR